MKRTPHHIGVYPNKKKKKKRKKEREEREREKEEMGLLSLFSTKTAQLSSLFSQLMGLVISGIMMWLLMPWRVMRQLQAAAAAVVSLSGRSEAALIAEKKRREAVQEELRVREKQVTELEKALRESRREEVRPLLVHRLHLSYRSIRDTSLAMKDTHALCVRMYIHV